jgi:hypothetical protein
MSFFYTYAVCHSALISGALRQSTGLVVLGVWYNNRGGADANSITRNNINALGYICFISGALKVALDTTVAFIGRSALEKWLGIIASIIFTTIHGQDLYDQKGDAARGRRTELFVIGDVAS